MNKKLFQSGKSLLSKLCLTSLLLIGMGNTAWADELTVNESATGQNYGIPFNAKKINTEGHFGEFIITSTQLENVKNKKITDLKFFPKSDVDLGEATFDVCLKEVDITVYPSSGASPQGGDGTTIVYSGNLTISKDNGLCIHFDQSFNYSGTKSLLVRFNCTNTIGTVPSSDLYFTGLSGYASSNYMSYGTTLSTARLGFQPKVTITYEDAEPTANPMLSLEPTIIDFGTLRASGTQTVTVTNTGVGSMDVTIDNDNTTDFTVSATSLTGIGEGKSKTFDVTFNYDAANLGEKTASITVTPSYDAADAKTIAVTATAADAAVWEDFSEGIPSTWYNQNDSWLTNVSGLNGMASPGWMASDILRTPRLYAEAGEVIGYDVKIGGTTSSCKLKAQYSTDREEWIDIATYTTTDTHYFTAPSTGYYWLRFTAYSSGVDNFRGWSVADITHEIKLGTATIPTEGTIFGKYTANVDVMELGGSEENITAELYFGETKVTEETVKIGGNRDETITLTYDLTEAFSGDVYIKVSGDNITAMETDKVNVTIGDTEYVLDENEEAVPAFDCSDAVVRINYTAKKGWNTIIMPFSLTGKSDYMNSIFGEGWKAYEMTAYNNGELTFENKTSMRYSVPYIVYAPNAETHPDGVYLTNIDIDSEEWTSSSIAQTKDDATFQGTYVPKAYADGEDPWYGLTPDGKIRKAGSGASVKAFHAYFTGISAPASGARLIVIEDDGEATNLGFVQMVDPEAKGVYTLSGQKVESAGKGIYIVNGKKVVIK